MNEYFQKQRLVLGKMFKNYVENDNILSYRVFCFFGTQKSHLNETALFSTQNTYRPPDNRVLLKFVIHISQPEHMLWVQKRSVSMRWFYLAPKTFV